MKAKTKRRKGGLVVQGMTVRTRSAVVRRKRSLAGSQMPFGWRLEEEGADAAGGDTGVGEARGSKEAFVTVPSSRYDSKRSVAVGRLSKEGTFIRAKRRGQ